MEQNQKLTQKYGLLTAIAMVIGIVIGSGVFFKGQNILNVTNGNLGLGILAWIIGGAIMIICAITFAGFAMKFQKVNGVVDYAEATCGKGYAYFLSWFMITIYYPGMTSVLAWVSARYTLVLFTGNDDLIASGLCLSLAAFYLCAIFAMNALAPKLAGKFQVSTTVIKLVPLTLVAIVGTVVGLINGNTVDAFTGVVISDVQGGGLFAAIIATVFAYEGWIVATSINAELKNAKRNLPLALLIGGVVIVAIYVLYFVGLAGAAPVGDLMKGGASVGFKGLFGNAGAVVLNLFVVISCLGTLNGLAVGCSRGMYAMGVRRQGPRPDVMAEISPSTNMPSNSAWVGLLICGAWLFYFYGANLTSSIFGLFTFDSSEIPIRDQVRQGRQVPQPRYAHSCNRCFGIHDLCRNMGTRRNSLQGCKGSRHLRFTDPLLPHHIRSDHGYRRSLLQEERGRPQRSRFGRSNQRIILKRFSRYRGRKAFGSFFYCMAALPSFGKCCSLLFSRMHGSIFPWAKSASVLCG